MTSTEIRKAVVAKLRAEGVTVHRYRQSAPELARLVQLIEPCLGGSPENILRAWLGIDPEPVRPNRFASTGRPYRLLPQMQIAAARARACQPPMKTPSGIGNWNQYTQFMLGNGRAQ